MTLRCINLSRCRLLTDTTATALLLHFEQLVAVQVVDMPGVSDEALRRLCKRLPVVLTRGITHVLRSVHQHEDGMDSLTLRLARGPEATIISPIRT